MKEGEARVDEGKMDGYAVKDLIVGFGTNQSSASVAVFLRSARSVYPADAADIVLVTNSVDGLEALIAETAARVVHTPNTYSPRTTKPAKAVFRAVIHGLRLLNHSGLMRRSPEVAQGYRTVLETWHHPQIARWFAYERLLRFMPGYRRVALCDVKDVVFQAPFFDDLPSGAPVLFEDGATFENEYYNRTWYIQAFGKAAYERIRTRTPICIGVSMGDVAAMRSMIADIVGWFERKPFGRIEQAVFNRLLLEGEFMIPPRVVRNFEGAVANLAGGTVASTVQLKATRIVRESDDRVFPVVHLYDRFEELNAAVLAAYEAPSSLCGDRLVG